MDCWAKLHVWLAVKHNSMSLSCKQASTRQNPTLLVQPPSEHAHVLALAGVGVEGDVSHVLVVGKGCQGARHHHGCVAQLVLAVGGFRQLASIECRHDEHANRCRHAKSCKLQGRTTVPSLLASMLTPSSKRLL